MAQKEPWISIPNTFLILWISIPVSCGSVSQTHFWFCGSVSLYPVDQYPKSISKRPLTKWSNGGQNSGDSQRVAQGLHRGCTGGARRAHRERTGSMQCPFYPTFLLFKLERWNLVSRMESWLQNHFKFLVARGHLQIPCGTRSFQILCGTRSLQILCGYGYSRKKTFDIILKLHEPGSMEIGQNLRFDIFLKIRVPGSKGIGQNLRFDIFLKIHVPGYKEIGEKWGLIFFGNWCRLM